MNMMELTASDIKWHVLRHMWIQGTYRVHDRMWTSICCGNQCMLHTEPWISTCDVWILVYDITFTASDWATSDERSSWETFSWLAF